MLGVCRWVCRFVSRRVLLLRMQRTQLTYLGTCVCPYSALLGQDIYSNVSQFQSNSANEILLGFVLIMFVLLSFRTKLCFGLNFVNLFNILSLCCLCKFAHGTQFCIEIGCVIIIFYLNLLLLFFLTLNTSPRPHSGHIYYQQLSLLVSVSKVLDL